MCGTFRALALRRPRSESSSPADASTISTTPKARRLITNRMWLQERTVEYGRRVYHCISYLELVLTDVCFVDGDPTRAGEGMGSSGDAFQVMVTGQAKIETGADFLSFDQHQRELVLRLAGKARVPKKNLVNRSVL